MGGHIDAMIADPMDVVTARRKGFPVLATQQQLDIQYVGSAIAMQGDFIKHDRETAMLFLKAISEGIHYYKTRQEEAAKIAAKYLKSNDTEAITSAVSVFASTIIPNIPVVTPGAIAPIQEGLAKSGSPGVKELKYEQFVDNSLVQELEKQGFYKQLYGN
jgi:ABC-type nitrate/sulfonate/bicarbonate transport system substrate-binding protein